ncbi:MAG: exopolysaccharide biosynthesis protein [Pseudolabrys sp.]|nr:exopolysaccharide biosynthesis protein [Pseudolabrys sp.]
MRTIQGAGKSATVSVGDLTDALGSRSFGPLLLVPSLILITPLSGIPGAPTTGAIIIVLVAAQMVFGNSKVWLPEFVRQRTLRRSRLNAVAKKLKPAARFVDRITSRRMVFLTHRPFSLLLVIPCIVLALAMPPLEIVPMTSTILASGIFLLALALTAQDGLLGLISLVLTVGAVVLALVLIF